MNLGRYELLEPLGKGGTGTVYRARDGQTGQPVAVKVLAAEMAADPILRQRFERECSAASRLDHPHIVRGLGFSLEGSQPYLVMELVEGGNLGQRVRRRGPLAEAEAIVVAMHIADALQLAHEHGLVHRDVKPDNVLLTPEGRAKLADLGLIKDLLESQNLTKSRTCLGTIAFMAPEQCHDAGNADARCDIYGLAATLYYALTAAVPFHGRGNLTTLRKKLENDLVPPSHIVPTLGKQLERVICAALNADPAGRPGSCREFAGLLAGAESAAASARPAAPRPANRRALPRHPCALGASCSPLRAGGQRWAAEAIDISLTGIHLQLGRRFEPGTVLNIEVVEEPADTSRTCLVRVQWVRQVGAGLWSIGCAFSQRLSEDELDTLVDNKVPTVVVEVEA